MLPARSIAGIVSRVVSTGLRIDPIAHLKTKSLYALLGNMALWHDILTVSTGAKLIIDFWLIHAIANPFGDHLLQ